MTGNESKCTCVEYLSYFRRYTRDNKQNKHIHKRDKLDNHLLDTRYTQEIIILFNLMKDENDLIQYIIGQCIRLDQFFNTRYLKMGGWIALAI
jgi:hypothetical protein